MLYNWSDDAPVTDLDDPYNHECRPGDPQAATTQLHSTKTKRLEIIVFLELKGQ